MVLIEFRFSNSGLKRCSPIFTDLIFLLLVQFGFEFHSAGGREIPQRPTLLATEKGLGCGCLLACFLAVLVVFVLVVAGVLLAG